MVLVAALAAEDFVTVVTFVDIRIEMFLLVSRQNRRTRTFLLANRTSESFTLLIQQRPHFRCSWGSRNSCP